MKNIDFKEKMSEQCLKMQLLVENKMPENSPEDLQLQTTIILKLRELKELIDKLEPKSIGWVRM
jgi:hypothetical protein